MKLLFPGNGSFFSYYLRETLSSMRIYPVFINPKINSKPMSKNYKLFLTKFFLLLIVAVMPLWSYAQQYIHSLDSSNPQIQWIVRPQAEVGEDSVKAFQLGYNTKGWVKAIVPGTVFASYAAAGLEKDPNFGDNIYKVDKAKYDRSFWYRTEFVVPGNFIKGKIWLNFQGINRKGDVYLNGKHIGLLDGFMQRGKFDVTGLLKKEDKNVLAILVQVPEHPMANYASPTYISSGGWDWMPYVPGLNSGITDKVFLSNSGVLIIENPWIRTDLPTNARADLSIELDIKNATPENRQGILKGVIMPGNIRFEQKVNVSPKRTTGVKLDKTKFEDLIVHNPKLWWPNGYGDPNLYTCELTLMVGDEVSDIQKVTFGIKKYTYDTIGGVLHVSINGRRVFIKGGNWGMSEYMLRCRGGEYDTKVRLHKEMNFNMIRNWLGSTTDEEFYEACDKYGIMVWDDFWLNANPNLPADIHCFNNNSIEKIKRVRNHPSIAVWCGNNEGWPEPPLNQWLRENIATFDGNARYYQPNSHEENLSGSGLWGNHDPRWYFTAFPTSLGGTPGWGLRTETGTAVFPNFESFKKFMPKDKWWPRNDMWNQHFFGQWAFNATPDKYDASITERYGLPKGIEDYCLKAQLLNIETNKAMYEGWTDHMWEDASGIMTWMSQSAYPSMVWQTYDYYYDLTGAYWGAKKACEPLHIQWNPVTNSVKVINTTSRDYEHLTAEISVFNTDGKEIKSFYQTNTINSYSNTATHCFTIAFNRNPGNLASGKRAYASSTETGNPELVTDGDSNTRWASGSGDNEWIYIDLGKEDNVNGVGLNWEDAYGKKFKIQVSKDAQSWKDVYTVNQGKAGKQELFFDDVTARYVRLLGIERATGWGYSLWDFKIYGGTANNEGLTKVHFIQLKLKDATGLILSDNMYWRGVNRTDFTALSALPEVELKVISKVTRREGKCYIDAKITNPASSPAVAFAVWVQVLNSKTGERVLPAVMSDNYFTLLKGETNEVRITFDEELLKPGEEPVLKVEPYNNTAKQ
jgi:hypothetical protein